MRVELAWVAMAMILAAALSGCVESGIPDREDDPESEWMDDDGEPLEDMDGIHGGEIVEPLPPPELGPTARFSHTCNGLECRFDATDSTPGITPIVEFTWIWGDNEPGGNGSVVDHTYLQEGVYTVYLAVTDEEGLWDQIERKIMVSEGDCDGPTPPGQQHKEGPGEVTCPGEYAIIDEGAGEGWGVPAWEAGFWWWFEVYGYPGPSCGPGTDNPRPSYQETVQSTQTLTGPDWSVAVYDLEETITFCDDDDFMSVNITRTQAHLNQINEMGDQGHVEHDLLFPLKEGKKWVYMDAFGALVEVEATYLGEFTAHDRTWRITIDVDDEEAPEITKYFDEDVGFWVQKRYAVEGEDELRIVLKEWHDGDVGEPPVP